MSKKSIGARAYPPSPLRYIFVKWPAIPTRNTMHQIANIFLSEYLNYLLWMYDPMMKYPRTGKKLNMTLKLYFI